MSMFSFPTEMNMSEMMKPASAMTDWTRAADFPVSPLMVYPLGTAAAATAIGFGMAGQMAGMMLGAMQGALQSQGAMMGAHPDLSWIMPTFAEDLAPEEDETGSDADQPAPASARSADVVDLKGAASSAPAVKTTKRAASGAAKPKAAPAKAKAKAEPASAAAFEKVKADAEVAAAAAAETVSIEKPEPAKAAPALEPEDFRRPAEIEKPATPDDLKLISGVGPKLEQVLNGLGIWTFAQIAAWQPEEAAWVDDYLQFKGRIDRDGWISQAAELAGGGTTA